MLVSRIASPYPSITKREPRRQPAAKDEMISFFEKVSEVLFFSYETT